MYYNNYNIAPFELLKKLQFSTDRVVIATNVFTQIPFRFESGKATNCVSYPSLPDGLNFDTEKYVISGTAKYISNGLYNISCSNKYSTTNIFPLNIYISGIMIIF